VRERNSIARSTTRSRARAAIGEPELVGAEGEPSAYRHAVWRRKHGFWILHQNERDIQLGVELGLWFAPREPGAPVPRFPIV
jgi:hypothetical protein